MASTVSVLAADDVWIDILGQEGLALEVEGTFYSTLNLLDATTLRLYPIFNKQGYESPRSLIVDFAGDMRSLGISDRLVVSRKKLVSTDVQLDFSNATFYSSYLSGGMAYQENAAAKLASWLGEDRTVRGSFYGPLQGDEVNAALANRLVAGRKRFVMACRSSQVVKVNEAVSKLIGLGVGLTPSGDDYLVGVLATMSGHQEIGDIRQIVETAISVNIVRTGSVSRLYLEEAIQNKFAKPIRELIASAGSDGAAIERSAETLLAHGATSGQDILTGIIDGLKVIKIRKEEQNSEIK